jgi:hypothetical protein
MTSRTSKAANGLATNLVSYAILALLQVLLAPIVLKIAGQEVLGAYSIVMQIIGYSLLLDLGISVAVGPPSVTLVVRSFNFFFKPKGAVGVKQKCQPTALNLKTTSFVK